MLRDELREKLAEWLAPIICPGCSLARVRGLIAETIIYEKTDQLLTLIPYTDAAYKKGQEDTHDWGKSVCTQHWDFPNNYVQRRACNECWKTLKESK